MNGKQKAAIAVGGILVALLVLFPQYRLVMPSTPGNVVAVHPAWPRSHVRWIGSRPPSRYVTVAYEVWVDPVLRSGFPESVQEEIDKHPRKVPKKREVVELDSLVRYEIATVPLLAAIAAALAPTVAAVYVLRTRVDGARVA